MHIAIDARLADYSPGGIAQYTLQLARALVALKSQERFTLLRAARPRVNTESINGAGQFRVITPPHHALEQVALPLELLRLRPALLHSTDFIPPLIRPCKSVITVHDLGYLRYPQTLTAESRRFYGKIHSAVRSADRLIAVSEYTRTDLQRLVGADPEKIDVVLEAAGPDFQPVRSEVELEAARARLGVTRPFVLFVGSFEPRKNLVALLDAFALVRKEADVQLALVGRRGWLYEPMFTRLSELGLEAHVRIAEDIPHRDLPPIYSAAAVLAFPSLYEGFGLPVLEAMACGCPVVASDRASLPEVVGQAGLLVPADDPSQLAHQLARVIADGELRADLVARGLQRSLEFSWSRAATETLAVYRRAAA